MNQDEGKEHPMLFKGPMVKAILERRKKQTRRIVKFGGIQAIVHDSATRVWDSTKKVWKDCPHGVIGDKIWVRETWAADKVWDKTAPSKIPKGQRIWHQESPFPFKDDASGAIRGKWR